MPISYEKAQKLFKERNITSFTFRKNHVISQAAWTKIQNGGHVDTRTIEALCKFLDCQPGDLIEYVPDEEA